MVDDLIIKVEKKTKFSAFDSYDYRTHPLIGSSVKIKARIINTRYTAQSDDGSIFMIGMMEVVDVLEGELLNPKNVNYITVKGNIPPSFLSETSELIVVLKTVYDDKYGLQFQIGYITKEVFLENVDDKKKFLETILSPSEIDKLYEAFEDPFEIIKNEDIEQLTNVKGIGINKANKIIEKYAQSIDYSVAYIALYDWGMTKNTIDRLIKQYRSSADLLVERIQSNPYILLEEVDGFGWSRCDTLALNSGNIEPTSNFRISAFISFYLRELAYGPQGHLWITLDKLYEQVMSTIPELNDGEGVTKFRNLLIEMTRETIDEKFGDVTPPKLYYEKETKRIGLYQFRKLEEQVAKELIRIKSGVLLPTENVELKLKQLELEQGWEFTEEQWSAVRMVCENQIAIITGGAGVGKSTVVRGILECLPQYTFAQCALSGRAASKLSEVTNQDGCTIHRLLEADKNGIFQRNEKNPLNEYNFIIIDEVSMIGEELFLKLLKAISKGTKIIMLGDANQLEAIGLGNLFKDMIESQVIPVAYLTKIHRQAGRSAIITESFKVKDMVHINPSAKWTGQEIRGELQDFEIDCYSNNIVGQTKILSHFVELLDKNVNSDDIQIIVPLRERGDISASALNNKIQQIVNPENNDNVITLGTTYKKKGAEEEEETEQDNKEYTLKVNDRIIVLKNTMDTMRMGANGRGEREPIFNGNIGKIKSISPDNLSMVINLTQQGDVTIPRKYFSRIGLAYAVTCHKLQGSSAPYVIVGIDESAYTLLSKELLYTAITRAEKYCKLCCTAYALTKCINNSSVSHKQTYLVDLLKEYEQSQKLDNF